MKVLRNIASTFGVTACMFLSGCSSSLSGVAPVIGRPILSEQQGNPHFALELPITNPGPDKLKVSIEISGASSEILNPYPVSKLSAGEGTTVFKICEVTQQRTKPILVKAKWNYHLKNGSLSFTVPPEQQNYRSQMK